MVRSVTVVAPGSVANVGCGFDMMGFAVEGLGDRFTLRENNLGSLRIAPIKGMKNEISCDPAKNTAGVAILEMCQHLKINPGFDVEIEKLSPVGSGLGSSASSTTAAVFALNEILGRPFHNKLDLLPFALKGESLASGSFHADNVAPSLLGGFIAVRSLDPVDLINIPVPATFRVVLIHPHLEVLTKAARGLVPQMVPLTKVTGQMGNLAAFIMGMVNEDVELLKRTFVDYLAEPYRAHLIPGYYAVKHVAMEMGAIGCSISGSGPSVFAIIDSDLDPYQLTVAMQAEFQKVGVQSDRYYSPFNRLGVELA